MVLCIAYGKQDTVIVNPQGEAIQCTRMDCFTLRVRNDGAAGKLHKSPCFLFALLKAK
jgi:hypothetical protein